MYREQYGECTYWCWCVEFFKGKREPGRDRSKKVNFFFSRKHQIWRKIDSIIFICTGWCFAPKTFHNSHPPSTLVIWMAVTDHGFGQSKISDIKWNLYLFFFWAYWGKVNGDSVVQVMQHKPLKKNYITFEWWYSYLK